MSAIDGLEPVKKDHQNFTYKAPKGMDYCSDLSVTKTEWGSVSVWKEGSLWERLKFLWTGEASLVIHGQAMPPVSLHIGDWYARESKRPRHDSLVAADRSPPPNCS